jgi:hypothetical protein
MILLILKIFCNEWNQKKKIASFNAGTEIVDIQTYF